MLKFHLLRLRIQLNTDGRLSLVPDDSLCFVWLWCAAVICFLLFVKLWKILFVARGTCGCVYNCYYICDGVQMLLYYQLCHYRVGKKGPKFSDVISPSSIGRLLSNFNTMFCVKMLIIVLIFTEFALHNFKW